MTVTEQILEEQKETLKSFGLIDDVEEIRCAISKLKEYCYVVMDSETEDFLFIEFSIILNMKTKVLIDSIFKNSRDYILYARCNGEAGGKLLNIYELINVFD